MYYRRQQCKPDIELKQNIWKEVTTYFNCSSVTSLPLTVACVAEMDVTLLNPILNHVLAFAVQTEQTETLRKQSFLFKQWVKWTQLQLDIYSWLHESRHKLDKRQWLGNWFYSISCIKMVTWRKQTVKYDTVRTQIDEIDWFDLGFAPFFVKHKGQL